MFAPQYEGDNAAVANEKCINLIKQVKETDEQIKALKEDSDKLKEEIRAYFGDLITKNCIFRYKVGNLF